MPARPRHPVIVAAVVGVVIATCRKEGVCVALRPRNTSVVRQLAWDGKFWRKELDSDHFEDYSENSLISHSEVFF